MAEQAAGNQNSHANENSIAVGNVSSGGSIDGSPIISSHK